MAVSLAIFPAISHAPAFAQSADSAMDMLDFESARNSFFGQADRNSDLALSFGEISDALGLTGPRIFEGNDFDGDGLISYSEYLESGTEIFTSLDGNADGILTMEEF